MQRTPELDTEGKRLLELLVLRLKSVKPNDPRTFISYKDAHEILRLPQVRETYGESLKAQGLISLAEWTFHTGKPGITGLIVDRKSLMPGAGYFQLFGKNENEFNWWLGEITKSINFDWSPYIKTAQSLEPPIAIDISAPADRRETTTSRIIRDTALSNRIKQLHNFECQICGHTIVLNDGTRYAEAHHIQPLGEPHNGPDSMENIICVCPNHHAELDYGARPLTLHNIRTIQEHEISDKYSKYHNTHIFRKSSSPNP